MPNCTEVMTKKPVCCFPTESVVSVAKIMRDEDIGSVPVIDTPESKQLIGIVTDRDLAIRVIANGSEPTATTVEEVMSPVLAQCREENDVHEAMKLMAQYQIRRIPVTNGDGQIVGIIAQADIATKLEEPSATGHIVEEISEP